MHHFKSELENHSGSLSLSAHETYLEPTRCFPGHSPKYDSHTDYESTPIPDEVDSLTRPARSLFTLNNIGMRDGSPYTVNTPAARSFRSLFHDLFHKSTTPVISSRHSKFPYTGIGDNHKHADGVSQSQFKIDESFRSDLSHSDSLDSHRSDFLSGKP